MLAGMAGYSGTPLPQKLGITPGAVVAVVDAPAEFGSALESLPPDVSVRSDVRGRPELAVWFVRSSRDLRAARIDRLADGRPLWIAWPKKASGVQTDLTRSEERR